MAQAYTVSIDGVAYGPVPVEELSQDIRRGLLQPGCQVWSASHNRWIPALQEPELYQLFYKHQELILASLPDPANPGRRLVVTNQRLLRLETAGRGAPVKGEARSEAREEEGKDQQGPEGRKGRAVGHEAEERRRSRGQRLAQGSLALSLGELNKVVLKSTDEEGARSKGVTVAVEYQRGAPQTLNFTLADSDKEGLVRALRRAHPALEVTEEGPPSAGPDAGSGKSQATIATASGPGPPRPLIYPAESKAREKGLQEPAEGQRECPQCGLVLKTQWRRCPYCEI